MVAYIAKLIENGYGYVAKGSVYFDLQQFQKNHKYGRLSHFGEEGKMPPPGEEEKGDKKHSEDFALWKAAKGKEEQWESPWGKGQPGYHVQSATIAMHSLGPRLYFRSVDITRNFPHNENVLALAVAHCGKEDSVKHLLHVG